MRMTNQQFIALLRYHEQSAALDGGIFWPDYFGVSDEEYSTTPVRHAATALERITRSA